MMIGHDSEFGLLQNGQLVSALDVMMREDYDDGSIFPDNANCEIAITPVATLIEFHRKTESLLDLVRDRGFELSMRPMLHYPKESEKHEDFVKSGCNPDYCAYTGDTNKAPDLSADRWRSCGAHIHLSDPDVKANPFGWAKWMDLYVGVPLLLEEEMSNRRKMYGGPGALREKPYGAEYRTLSNVWLDKPKLREFVWWNTLKALGQVKEGREFDSLVDWADVPNAIENHDVAAARRIINRTYALGVRHVT